MRHTVLEIKVEDTMLTSEVSIVLIKGANATNKAGVAHVMEASVLQTTMAVMTDNTVTTRKWSSLQATSVTFSAPT
jgi:hypothetical protein